MCPSNCTSQTNNVNGQQSTNEINEPYDNGGVVEFGISPQFLNGDHDKNVYSSSFGTWDLDDAILSEDFKKHYEVWLQKEVFNVRVDWDSLKTVYDLEDSSVTNIK